MNVVSALNAVLSETFGVPCYFIDFKTEVPAYKDFYGNWHQGNYTGYVTFACSDDDDIDCYADHKGTNIMLDNADGTYLAVLLKDSDLRKKLLQAMLDYN